MRNKEKLDHLKRLAYSFSVQCNFNSDVYTVYFLICQHLQNRNSTLFLSQEIEAMQPKYT
jgi:hypothetical protein